MFRFPPRLSPLLILVFFWTMVVAPWCVARCAHDGGRTHFHALGAECIADAGADEPSHGHGGAVCASPEAPEAVPSAGVGVPPVPCAGPAPEPLRWIPMRRGRADDPVCGRPQGPPAGPVRRTHGRGALPLLT